MSLDNSSISLSPKQLEFIRNSKAKINIAHGAVRSGKTHASLIRFIELVLRCPDNDIIMIGNSFSAIEANAVRPIVDSLMRGYCTWQRGNQCLTIMDKKIRVLGAHDESAVRAIQGNTHSLAYVDEMTTIPPNFLDMLTTRLSKAHSRMVGTCNPDSPVHPVKTNFLDNPDEEYCYGLHFEIDDNPSLAEKTKKDLKTKYSGLFYQRYIQGLWVQAEGAIFADFDRKTHVLARSPGFAQQYYVGIDYGAQNPFAAVMIGYRSEHSPRFWVEKEFYWDPKKTFKQKTNSEFADDIARFIDGYNVRGLYLDPSAESFSIELKRQKIRCLEADNDVFPGITFVANLVSNHQLKILDNCPNLIKEVESYCWDSRKAARGIEEPIKLNDHACFVGNTLIHTEYGPIKIEDLVGYEGKLYNYCIEARHFQKDDFLNVCQTREDAEIWELETENGKILKATGDHRIYTKRGWVEMRDIQPEDEVLTVNIKNTREESFSKQSTDIGDPQTSLT